MLESRGGGWLLLGSQRSQYPSTERTSFLDGHGHHLNLGHLPIWDPTLRNCFWLLPGDCDADIGVMGQLGGISPEGSIAVRIDARNYEGV